ncbi:MAG: NAD kinase [Bacteroidetes bacterium]|nr:NAD kinase [Bacteroidota bacterium]MBS1539096.1 NAD kinase [Bacteroidota bacterium]
MRIGIHGKDFQNKSSRFLIKILDELERHGVETWVSDKFAKSLKASQLHEYKIKTFDHDHSLKHLDFFLSLGGDGTMLESVTYVRQTEVPILGINTGRLGFLAVNNRDDLERAIEALINEKYKIDSRSLLKLISTPKLFDGLNFGLNDFTIMKKDTSSMITVHVFVDGKLLNSYWADGVIVSTPTGSTGYSLSCGGPLVYPESESFIITPVSPHNLGIRPIVLSDKSEITFLIEGRSKKYLISLDSRFETIDETVKLKIKKEKFRVNLIQLEDQDYFDTLRQKLNWGLDIRN